MTSRYALVQFHPDPTSDERLDVGVIAWDAAGAHVVFIESWERVHAISLDEVRQLQDFAELVRARLADGGGLPFDEATGELADEFAAAPAPGIRLSPVRSAPEAASKLVASLSAQLHYPPAAPKARRVRDRRIAASHAHGAILAALRKRAPKEAARLVHARRMLDGKFGQHLFDVVLAGDEPTAAVDALSFEVTSPRHLQRDVDAIAWALDDVRKLHGKLPLAVFILPPTNPGAEGVLKAASKVFRGVGASLITAEPSMARWAVRQAGLAGRAA